MQGLFNICLLAGAAAAAKLNYAVPKELAAADDCTLPANFTITDFVTYTNFRNSSPNYIWFQFTDPTTNIDTCCQKNASSQSTAPGAATPRWPCDNSEVEFIYQTTGIVGLTIIEKACSSSGSTSWEASGLVQPKLQCRNTTADSTCFATNSPIFANFTSLEPTPE